MQLNATSKIEFVAVGKTFPSFDDEIRAIENVNFKVFPGEFVSILGSSGCGKSTILNLIANFIEPTVGNILVDGNPAYYQNGRYGMVFQSDAAFPWMTVKQNIHYGLNQANKGKIGKVTNLLKQGYYKFSSKQTSSRKVANEDLVQHYIDLLGLKDFADKYPRELSGGLRKRVELGRAYASQAETLLLDEPFGSLDVLTKQEMQLLLHRIWERERKTVVFVTHDVEEAIFLSQRVLVMTPRPGTIKEEFIIPFELPRAPSLKLSQQFLELRKKIVSSLEDELNKVNIHRENVSQ